MSQYRIRYKVWEPAWEPGHGHKELNSPIFEYPNNIHMGEKIQIQLDKFCWSKEVSKVGHSLLEGYSWIYVKEPTSHEIDLEQMTDEAKEAFAKLEEIK